MKDHNLMGVDLLLAELKVALSHAQDAPGDLMPSLPACELAPTPTLLPVLEQIDRLAAQAPPASQAFLRQLAKHGRRLEWRQTYRRPDVGDDFLCNYGWTELVGARGLHRDPTVSIGLLILGPNTHYALHRHPAIERYIPLSGEAEWFDEERGWRAEPPLRTIFHGSMIGHATRTGDQPLLAFFHWSGDGVGVSARLF